MSEVCQVCGLPKDLCVCEEIAREKQRIRIYSTRRRFGKWMTVIEGIDDKDVDTRDLTKKLKAKLACGGTVKDGRMEFQGDHRERVKVFLIKTGFPEDTIDVM
jgi:translation initiation factor 1